MHTLHDYQNVSSVPPQDLTWMMSSPTKVGLLEVKKNCISVKKKVGNTLLYPFMYLFRYLHRLSIFSSFDWQKTLFVAVNLCEKLLFDRAMLN